MNKNLRYIGVIESIKILFLTIVIVLHIPVLFKTLRIVFGSNTWENLHLGRYYWSIWSGMSSSGLLLTVQFVMVGITILIIGPIAAKLIIFKKRNFLLVGVLMFLILWVVELVVSDICVGYSNYWKFNDQDYLEKILNWEFNQMKQIFLQAVLPTSVISGFIFGWRIKKYRNKILS